MTIYVVIENYTAAFFGIFDDKRVAYDYAKENDGEVIEYNLDNYTLYEGGRINPCE